MAISKIILNGVTQMDVTGKTVTAGDMLSGVTALKNDGTDITGNIANMTLPSASSSTSSGTSKATITPTSSAQYLNIPAGYLDTAQYYTIAAASGGASNLVTGTFKGTTTGAAMDVDLAYTGSGYPIAVIVYPKEGTYNQNTGSYYSLIQRYATQFFSGAKCEMDTTPTYENSSSTQRRNSMSATTRYKSSTSNSTNHSQTGNNTAVVYRGSAATSDMAYNVLSFKTAKKMSVFIASTSYGFAANIEYTYHVIYSS